MTDNSELVRRRGRWLNHKMMEVYVQEVTSILYLSKLDHERKAFVLSLTAVFEELLQKAERWSATSIPPKVWHCLLRYGQASQPKLMGMTGKEELRSTTLLRPVNL